MQQHCGVIPSNVLPIALPLANSTRGITNQVISFMKKGMDKQMATMGSHCSRLRYSSLIMPWRAGYIFLDGRIC